MQRPFLLDEARAAGMTSSALKGRSWKRLASKIYCSARWTPDEWQLLDVWLRRLPASFVFAGATAAWMHGLDLRPTDPVEIILPLDSSFRTKPGVVARRCGLDMSETTLVRGFPATTLSRSLLDLCAVRAPVDALIAIDMALVRGFVNAKSLATTAEMAAGRPGAARFRLLAATGEPAESPMETRLRWLLLQAGLPRPQVQTELRGEGGRFLGRADMFFRSAGLVVEFDGGNHRDRLVADDRRQNLLISAGYRVLRFTTADLYGRPALIVAQVRDALRAPIAPSVWRQTAAIG